MSHSSPTSDLARDPIEVAFPSATVAIVSLFGEHDLSTEARLEHALESARGHRRHVLVDLSGCSFLDSTVIKRLLGTNVALRAKDGHLSLIVPKTSTHVARVLDLMDIGRALSTFETLNQALARVEHTVRIRDMRERFGDPEAFAAECSCGWQGEPRRGTLAKRTARSDGNTHAAYERPARAR